MSNQEQPWSSGYDAEHCATMEFKGAGFEALGESTFTLFHILSTNTIHMSNFDFIAACMLPSIVDN